MWTTAARSRRKWSEFEKAMVSDSAARTAKKQVRLLIVDDHEIFRTGVRRVLQSDGHWDVCGEAATGDDAIKLAHETKPEVIVMDVSMPGTNGIQATRSIVSSLPDTKILLLTWHTSKELVRSGFAAGASGYLLKSDAGRDLIEALETIVDGTTYVSAAIGDVNG
jgi:DNA-binding NarL/FixJ family response regulator